MMNENLKKRLLRLLKYEGVCLGILAAGTVIPIVNWIVWLPALFIAVRINPRPPVMLTTSIAVSQYAILGLVLWLIKGRKNGEIRDANKAVHAIGASAPQHDG